MDRARPAPERQHPERQHPGGLIGGLIGGLEMCTTEVVPGAFTEGDVRDEDYFDIVKGRAPALLMDR